LEYMTKITIFADVVHGMLGGR